MFNLDEFDTSVSPEELKAARTIQKEGRRKVAKTRVRDKKAEAIAQRAQELQAAAFNVFSAAGGAPFLLCCKTNGN